MTAISIVLIPDISIFFLVITLIISRILMTLVGVSFVVLSFFGALGFVILVRIEINVNIVWILAFIIVGLGVDEIYIFLLALKQHRGYTKKNFVLAMEEIFRLSS